LTSADATAQDLARLIREHWSIHAHHHFPSPGPDIPGRHRHQSHWQRTRQPGHHPGRLIAAIKDAGYLHIPEGRRDHTTPAETLRLHHFD